MDSEASAFNAAQQKHHRYMIFGKKQRYIEVFQCSGEDMNLVLTGGIPAPVSPAKAAPALLSPGMLPPVAHLPPTNIPPPPPQTSVAQMSQSTVTPTSGITWGDTSSLLAQQQAQMIAQQNLLVRQSQAHAQAAQAAQAQNEHMLLMNHIAQHNLAVLNQGVGPVSATPPPNMAIPPPMVKAAGQMPVVPHLIPHHQQVVLVPQRIASMGMPRHALAYPPHLMQAAMPGVVPYIPQVPLKRSYGDAFTEQSNPAKRTFQTPSSVAVPYQQYYPNV